MAKSKIEPAPKGPDEPRGRGRPTVYRPEFCQRVIELGEQGKSITQMAARLGVDKATVVRWRADHEDFCNALARALTLSQDWWEEQGQRGVNDKNFNATLYNKIVASRFREDYSERQEITGANGGAIKIEAKRIDVENMEEEQMEALENALSRLRVVNG
jgi:transposase-like protein